MRWGGRGTIGGWAGVVGAAVLLGAIALDAVLASVPAIAQTEQAEGSPTVEPTAPAEVAPSPSGVVDPSATTDPSPTDPGEATPTGDPAPTITPELTPSEGSTAQADGGSEEATAVGRRARARAPVTVADDVFRPPELTVTVGDEVVWTNQGLNPHTVTADDRAFDSGTLETGQRFSVTFDQVGEVPYYCQIHGEPGSGMFGVVIVRAASQEGQEEDGGGGSPSPTSSSALAGTGAARAIPLGLAALGLAIAGLAALWAGRGAMHGRG
ncbi:MAG TPA: plastocyanin/azurin family copper-binding protein [Actinomycetota bacterium]